MTPRTFVARGLCSLSLLLFAACSQQPTPPPPLALEQIPAELGKAFKQAKQEAKDLVAQVSSAVEKKDYPEAFSTIQNLCNLEDETSQQRSVAVRALLSINAALQEAGRQGDEKAAAALESYRSSK